MKRIRPATLLLALAFAATPALAQNSTQHFTLDGVNGYHTNGVYVGAYYGHTPGMPSFPVYCDDFSHEVYIGQNWDANFTSVQSLLDNNANLERTRWGQVDAIANGGVVDVGTITKYQKAAWLATQFASHGTGDWGGIHSALWNIFTPGTPSGWSGTSTWLSNANSADLSGIDWSYWYVVTDVTTTGGEYGAQEYLTYITPEPGTLLLLGTGLAGIIGMAIVRRRVA